MSEPLVPNNQQIPPELISSSKFSKFKILIFGFFGSVIFLLLIYFLFFSAPLGFRPGTILQIEPGMSLRSISLTLKNENIIRSRLVFEALVIFLGGEKRIKYSSYLFEEKGSVYEVAKKIINNDRFLAPVVVTVPEGLNLNEVANIYQARLIKFNKINFLQTANEGYLFPDTYYFFNSDNEVSVINAMSKNFEKKLTPIRSQIVSSGKGQEDIIVMASIIEKEAKGDDDRAIISGILWKRISQGIRLQVDAVPETYKTKGLPKNPISNPGLKAINAAIFPQSSGYLYYLHGKDGNTYYAKTFTDHKKNIAKYLK